MNERIKQLAEQAELPLLDVDGNCKYGDTYFSKEKFAELLIQKCVDISDDYVKGCTCEEHVNCKHPRSAIGRKIKEHFGVEE